MMHARPAYAFAIFGHERPAAVQGVVTTGEKIRFFRQPEGATLDDPRTNYSHDNQISYWDEIASTYDRLYSTRWSQLEDALVSRWIAGVDYDFGRVLDLACGTGHGYELLRSALSITDYLGVDISKAMLVQLADKHPDLSTLHGSMDQLSALPSNHYSLVTAFYSSASYSADPRRLLKNINRLLKSGGYVYFSMLNKTSLRRMIRGKRGGYERYRTRGDTKSASGVPVIPLSRQQLKNAVDTSGLSLVSVHSHGTLAGVFEHPAAWPLSRMLDRAFPYLGHSFDLIARKVN